MTDTTAGPTPTNPGFVGAIAPNAGPVVTGPLEP